MARLRVRIELNRGGVGVPLHKLASVVEETQKFFHMLTEDIQIDHSKGEWLGFDFGNESLNFTAEFVGPATAEQVAAFHAAFDGTTSLRRATIAQFARITKSIEQDELIGFGLYLNDDGNEPAEWRCLTRRDALRITEEMQLLMEASGESDRESHLPAASNSSAAARLFSDRRERGLQFTDSTPYLRELAANLDRRITRVEQTLEGQSELIEDLHSKSASTENSVRKLLTAVEGFCIQTTRQLEAISLPAVATAAPAASVAMAHAAVAAGQAAPAAAGQTAQETFGYARAAPEPEPQPVVILSPTPQKEPELRTGDLSSAGNSGIKKLNWRIAAGFVLLLAGAAVLGVRTWQNSSPAASVQPVRPAGAAPVPAMPAVTSTPALASTPSGGSIRPHAADSQSSSRQPARVESAPATGAPLTPPTTLRLEASELTWISLRNAAGSTMSSRVLTGGDTQTLQVPEGAVLRVGNAAGLRMQVNGKPIGELGAHGQVREVVFQDCSYSVN